MIIDPATVEPGVLLEALGWCVAPRPLALVCTLGQEGAVNVAPYSSLLPLGIAPPVLGLGIHPRLDGGAKTSLRNIEASGELVISMVSSDLAARAVAAADRPGAPEVALAPSQSVGPPRVRDAAVSFECRLVEILRPARSSAALVVAAVELIHLEDTGQLGSRGLPASWVTYLPVGHVGVARPGEATIIGPEGLRRVTSAAE